MPDSYEVNGIVFFKQPYKVNCMDWVADHLDCDTVVEHTSINNKLIMVLCYAVAKKYNAALEKVRDEKFGKDYIMRGMNSKEVQCVES